VKTLAIVVASILALFVGSAVVAGVIEGTGAGGGESGSRAESGGEGKPDGYVRVRRVIDGDSVVLTRFGETRLIGVNTPEEGRCYETEATRFTRDRLEGKRVGYEFDEDRRDRYGRTLAYLYRGGMHNLALVENGHAKALTIAPNRKYANRFIEAQGNAEDSGKGGWSGECEQRRAIAAEERREDKRRRARARAQASERAEERRRTRQSRDADGDGEVDDAPKATSGSGGGSSGGGSSGSGGGGGGGEDNFNIPGIPGD
jgi:micrococcal nuclease